MAESIAGDARFIYIIPAYFVRVAEWHVEPLLLAKATKRDWES